MAEEEKKSEKSDKSPEKGTESSPPKKKGFPLKLVLIVLGVLTVLGVGGFFLWSVLEGGKGEAAEKGDKISEEGHGSGNKADHAGEIVSLETFIINLADINDIRYLKVTVSLEIGKGDIAEEIKEKNTQIRDSILILLSSKSFEDINTVQGKFKLRDEIVERTNNLLKKGKVKTVYFSEFVVQ